QEDKLAGLAFERVAMRQRVFAQTLPAQSKEEIQRKKAWNNWGIRSGNASQIKNALSVAKQNNVDGEPVAISGRQFDSNPTLLGCANGILELTAEPFLRPPQKEDYVTYNTNVEYHPWDVEYARENGLEDAYTLWQNYLEKFLPDPEIRQFIQKVLGHCLIGENPEKLIIIVYGP